MRRLGWGLLAGLLLLVAEVFAFAAVADRLGLAWALGLLLALSAAGAWATRRVGVRGWRRFRQAEAAGRPPGREASHALVGLAGTLLLAAPGFVSALLGLLLLTPPVRAVARGGVERWAARRVPGRLAGELFGPRRVRVRQGRPRPGADPAPPPAAGTPKAIEGEIVG